MRRMLLAAVAALALSGCTSTLQGMYDERAREECDQQSGAGDRGACYDRVEQNSRDRDW
ncbi:MAG: lipoprotein [Hyphomonadaceae bacterium]